MAFCYLPSFPFNWNSTYTALQFSRRRVFNHPCWCILMLIVLISGLICVYNPAVFGFINPVKAYDKLNLFVSIIASYAVATIVITSYHFFTQTELNLFIVNQWISLDTFCNTLSQRYAALQSKVNLRPKINWKALVALLIPLCLTAPFWTPIAVLLNFDCFYWPLDAYILTNPMYRSLTETLVAFVVQVVLMAIVICESFRTATFAVSLVILELDNFCKILSACEAHISNSKICRGIYVQWVITMQKAEFLLHTVIYMAFNTIFWFCVFAI